MTKLLTPDYFTQNTCLFKDNFLHEIPVDIQVAIMKRVEKDERKELERKRRLEIEISRDIAIGDPDDVFNIVGRSLSNILWELKWRIGEHDDYDKFLEILYPLIGEECEVENLFDPRLEDIEKLVNKVGVMFLMQELVSECDVDITEHTSIELYEKCYYRFLYNRITDYYDHNDIKIIQKYNIDVLNN